MTDGLPKIEDFASFEELRAHQEKRLEWTIDQAARSPFYRERLSGAAGGALELLAAQQPTTKEDLRDSYPYGMLAVPRDRVATYHESSGSTGEPTPSYYTEAEWVDLNERFARKSVPMTAADTMLVRIPYALVLAGHLAHQAALSVGATVIAGDCRSMAMPYPRVVRVLRDTGVTLTWSTPNECLVWAAAARLSGDRPDTDFPALRAFYVGGEPLSRARQERITQLWDTPVVEEYGCTEAGSMAGVCSDGRMHFWADRILPEIRDPATGSYRPEGTGQLVITPLYREAMPLLRYALEDRVELRNDSCGCGWALPTIRVLGRMSQGYPIGGRPVGQIPIEEQVYRLPIELGVLFYRARVAGDHLEVQLEAPDEHAGDAVALLGERLPGRLDVPCRVTAVPPGTLVPHDLLGNPLDLMKPKKVFGPGEDWDQAVLRC
jgi:phenylacetate-CoA ligase